jgi:hypothetical protein
VLSTRISRTGIISDPTVSGFVSDAEKNQPDENTLDRSKKAYQQALLAELFDFTPIQRNAMYCLKLLNEHKDNIADGLPEQFEKFAGLIRTDLADVSVKFNRELLRLLDRNANTETNPQLQERVNKACMFFSERLSDILGQVITGMTVESDNKAVRKPITEAIEKLRQETMIKLTCLESVKSGFAVKKYLHAKARAVLELPAPKPRKSKLLEDASGADQHPTMWVKAWRNKGSRDEPAGVYDPPLK